MHCKTLKMNKKSIEESLEMIQKLLQTLRNINLPSGQLVTMFLVSLAFKLTFVIPSHSHSALFKATHPPSFRAQQSTVQQESSVKSRPLFPEQRKMKQAIG